MEFVFGRLLLLAALVYIAWRILFGARRGAARRDQGVVQMQQDPVCGTFVPANQAVSLRRHGKTYFFCSTACRDKFKRS